MKRVLSSSLDEISLQDVRKYLLEQKTELNEINLSKLPTDHQSDQVTSFIKMALSETNLHQSVNIRPKKLIIAGQ